jgi:hypothetical protein
VLLVDDGEGFRDYFRVAGFGFEPCDAVVFNIGDIAIDTEVVA